MIINNDYFKEWRKEKKLTQLEVAKLIDVSDSFVSLVESGRSNLSLDNLLKLDGAEEFSASKYLGLADETTDLKKEVETLIIENKAKDSIIEKLRKERENLESEVSIYHAKDALKSKGVTGCN